METHASLPNYTFLTSYERNFKYALYDNWLQNNWQICLPTIVVYVISIFTIQKMMSDRKPFDLRNALCLWSLGLSVFSLLGAIRFIPELIHVWSNYGLHHAICTENVKDGVIGFWLAAFVFSKFLELGDTLFIVLRKQKLIFLHWYHHSTVLFSVCHNTLTPLSTARWFMTANYAIHFLMYGYYALRARGVRVPKVAAMVITTLQLIQMVIGVGVTWYAWNEQNAGRSCSVDRKTLVISFICYGSYFVLFANFFANAYLFGAKKSNIDKNSNAINNNTLKKKL